MFTDVPGYQRIQILCSELRHLAMIPLRLIQGSSLYRSNARRIVGEPVVKISVDTNQVEKILKERLYGFVPHEKITAQNVTHFIGEISGLEAGFAQLIQNPRDVFEGYWLFSLKVWGPMCGLGIGESIVRAVVKEAERCGASELFLFVSEDNERAIRLYRKVGFTPFTDTYLKSIDLTWNPSFVVFHKSLISVSQTGV